VAKAGKAKKKTAPPSDGEAAPGNPGSATN
jgi:hypothetical protein